MPKVSVIIPVYGVEKYIERCARSLFEQTLDDIEFIFVDDCTPDKSIEILESIIEEYRLRLTAEKKTVRIERMPTNSGQAAVRRHGIQLATGDYIIHCDSDDWVDVDMYRAMYERAAEEQADCVICDYYITDNHTKRHIVGTNNLDKYQIISEMLSDNIAGSLCNKLFSRKLYSCGITYPEGSMAEDIAVSTQLIYYAEKVAYIQAPFYYYYVNSDSITRKITKEKAIANFNAATNNAQIVVDFLKEKGIENKFDRELVNFKYREKGFLTPYLADDEVNHLWRRTFKEVNIKMLFSDEFSVRRKIKYVLFLVKLRKSFLDGKVKRVRY